MSLVPSEVAVDIVGGWIHKVMLQSYVGRITALSDKSEFSWEEMPTPILDMVENPINMKNLSTKELKQLADEIRGELSHLVSKGQRALQASLHVVELTVAIHYVFHAPMDIILWDKGDQDLPWQEISKEKENV
ncbi:putative 1-deoxy-D-xylulose-5-phosphate synthase, chloroplastic [Silene latifolia]|uniref:putative 1-deoxy-D-xylulose-5-phosphate synthase, chloroplastic n=1 Tax=Silene latifolia TaxID=37657 RepID=UPI003D785D68